MCLGWHLYEFWEIPFSSTLTFLPSRPEEFTANGEVYEVGSNAQGARSQAEGRPNPQVFGMWLYRAQGGHMSNTCWREDPSSDG